MEGSSRRRPRPARRRSRSLRGRRGTDRRVLEQSGARDRPRRLRLHHERQPHVDGGRERSPITRVRTSRPVLQGRPRRLAHRQPPVRGPAGHGPWRDRRDVPRPRPARRRSRSLGGRRGRDRRVLEQSGARDRPRRLRVHHERKPHVDGGRERSPITRARGRGTDQTRVRNARTGSRFGAGCRRHRSSLRSRISTYAPMTIR